MHKFPYKWYLKDGYPEKNGLKVFSCFACGGGSTMGYKLAGFDVIGANEIDPKMAECYKVNHNPRHLFIEPIQEFKLRDDLPAELYDLDILDGSPPCSSFSMAGNREKDWGKEKKFREGQAEQILDTLFFDFIDLAEKLKPKVVIAENVKGLLLGDAKKYVWKIYQAFDKAGYHVHKWLLDASKMGVPQRRERVFFVALRKDLTLNIEGLGIDLFNPMPHLDMEFNEPGITFGAATSWIENITIHPMTENYGNLWEKCKPGYSMAKVNNGNGFNNIKFAWDKPAPTIASSGGNYHPKEKRHISKEEYLPLGTFPQDYNFKKMKNRYMIGMSVPPLMTAQIATRIKEQWFDRMSL